MRPVVPVPHQIRIRDQHARGVGMRLKNADRLAGLHEQSLVVFESAQRIHDRMKAIPIARGFPGAAVDDQIFRTLGDLRIEIVHQHAQRGFLLPTFAGNLTCREARGRADSRVSVAVFVGVMLTFLQLS